MNGETTVEEVIRVAYSGSGLMSRFRARCSRGDGSFRDNSANCPAIGEEAAVAVEPALDLESSGPEMVSAGETVALKLAVVNSGTAPLSEIKITAPYFDAQWCHLLDRLAPGQRAI